MRPLSSKRRSTSDSLRQILPAKKQNLPSIPNRMSDFA
jgi:hypothetical protein